MITPSSKHTILVAHVLESNDRCSLPVPDGAPTVSRTIAVGKHHRLLNRRNVLLSRCRQQLSVNFSCLPWCVFFVPPKFWLRKRRSRKFGRGRYVHDHQQTIVKRIVGFNANCLFRSSTVIPCMVVEARHQFVISSSVGFDSHGARHRDWRRLHNRSHQAFRQLFPAPALATTITDRFVVAGFRLLRTGWRCLHFRLTLDLVHQGGQNLEFARSRLMLTGEFFHEVALVEGHNDAIVKD